MNQLPLAVAFSGPNEASIELSLKSVESAATEVDLKYVHAKEVQLRRRVSGSPDYCGWRSGFHKDCESSPSTTVLLFKHRDYGMDWYGGGS